MFTSRDKGQVWEQISVITIFDVSKPRQPCLPQCSANKKHSVWRVVLSRLLLFVCFHFLFFSKRIKEVILNIYKTPNPLHKKNKKVEMCDFE